MQEGEWLYSSFLFISPEGISKLNSCALHFFAMYFSPLKPKACAAKTDFFDGFLKHPCFIMAVFGTEVRHWPLSEVYRLVNFFKKPVHNASRHFSCLLMRLNQCKL